MANYQYNMTPPNRSPINHSDRNYWILSILLLIFLPPIGILMIVLKLLNSSKRPAVRGQHPYYTQTQGQAPVGAKTTAGTTSAIPSQNTDPAQEQKLVAKKLASLSSKGTGWAITGAVISGIFGAGFLSTIGNAFWFGGNFFGYIFSEALPILCAFFGGLGCLWAGLRTKKRVRIFKKCLSAIGTRKTVSISVLASALGLSPTQVRSHLETMLELGLFPAGYLDYGRDQLVLTADGIPDPDPVPESDSDQEENDPQNTVLEEIRTLTAEIDNPKLSQQVDRIGVITAKVFEYQRTHPQKSPQLHSFLSYYLPTTLKILRAYAQLEDQEVDGENISTAMERIEGMMDKVVEGFEKQLDQLFQGDVLDITSDVAVLEKMLAKDGLSSEGGLRLGG